MKDFSWNFFWNTGQIDAYLLYKQVEMVRDPFEQELVEEDEE